MLTLGLICTFVATASAGKINYENYLNQSLHIGVHQISFFFVAVGKSQD